MRLIDADALLKKAWHAYVCDELSCIVDREDIDNMPTIDPVKHGQWIDVELVRSYGHLMGVRCSECGHERLKSRVAQPKFCENCGAEMGGLE